MYTLTLRLILLLQIIILAGSNTCYITRTHKTSCWASWRCKPYTVVQKRCLVRVPRDKSKTTTVTCEKLSLHHLSKLQIYRAKCRRAVYVCRASNSRRCRRIRQLCSIVFRVLSRCNRWRQQRHGRHISVVTSCKVSYYNCRAVGYSKRFCSRRYRHCISLHARMCFRRAIRSCTRIRCFNQVIGRCMYGGISRHRKHRKPEKCLDVLRGCQKAGLSSVVCLKSYLQCRKMSKRQSKIKTDYRYRGGKTRHKRRWRYQGRKCAKEYLQCRASKGLKCRGAYLSCHAGDHGYKWRKHHYPKSRESQKNFSHHANGPDFREKFLRGCGRLKPYQKKCQHLINHCQRRKRSQSVCLHRYLNVCKDVITLKKHCKLVTLTRRIRSTHRSVKANCLKLASYKSRCRNLILFCKAESSQVDHVCSTRYIRACEKVLAVISYCQLTTTSTATGTTGTTGTGTTKRVVIPVCRNSTCSKTATYAMKCSKRLQYCKSRSSKSNCFGMYRNICGKLLRYKAFCCAGNSARTPQRHPQSRCARLRHQANACLDKLVTCRRDPHEAQCFKKHHKLCSYTIKYVKKHCSSKPYSACRAVKVSCSILAKPLKTCYWRRRVCKITQNHYPPCSNASFTAACIKVSLSKNCCTNNKTKKSYNSNSYQDKAIKNYTTIYQHCVEGVQVLKEREKCAARHCTERYRILNALCYIRFYRNVICIKIKHIIDTCSNDRSQSCSRIKAAYRNKCRSGTVSTKRPGTSPCRMTRLAMRKCYARHMSHCSHRRRYHCHVTASHTCRGLTRREASKCDRWKRKQVARQCQVLSYKAKICKTKSARDTRDFLRKTYCEYIGNMRRIICARANKLTNQKQNTSRSHAKDNKKIDRRIHHEIHESKRHNPSHHINHHKVRDNDGRSDVKNKKQVFTILGWIRRRLLNRHGKLEDKEERK